jgi:hypothetical protein
MNVVWGIVILAVAVAVAVATMLLLTCHRAVANALSFLAGWMVGVAAVIFLLVLLVNGLGLNDSDPLWIALVELAIGAGFLLAVGAVWRHRHERAATFLADGLNGL